MRTKTTITLEVPIHEHELKETIVEDIFYPDHAPRKESKTFLKTKKAGHAKKIPCAISGTTDKSEYHHCFIEWSDTDAVDWELVKKIGTGEITEIPVLDLITDQATAETFPVEQSLIWIICKLAELRGFNWKDFDPTQPETFVDSMENMLVLHEKFHRSGTHGIHHLSLPIWIFQAFPRKNGFIFCKDEEK